MPLPVPNLDDRTYDQLVSEARGLIPRYFPAWTDYNPSDPGSTLLELFAFFMEAAIYQINRVPERSLEHFAGLVGVTRKRDAAGEPEPIESTLRRALEALAEVYRAVTIVDFELLVRSEFLLKKTVFFTQPRLRFGHQVNVSAVFMDTLAAIATLDQDATAGSTSLVLSSSAGLAPNDIIMIVDEEKTEFARIAPAVPEALPVTVTINSPLMFYHARDIKISKVTSPFPATKTSLNTSVKEDDNIVELKPVEQEFSTGVLRIDTDSLAEYVFVCSIARVKAVVEVIDPASLVVTLTVKSVEDGAISVEPFDSGNYGLPYGSLVTKISSKESTYIAVDIPSHQLAVTQIIVQDPLFAKGDLLKVTPKQNVFPDDQFIKVVIVPNQPDSIKPKPSEELRQKVFELLRQRSLITTRLQVVEPDYKDVSVDLTVVRDISSRLDQSTVRLNVEQSVEKFLSPLTGGIDGTGWEFGRPVYRSELYHIIEGVDGVDHVRQLLLNGSESDSEVPLNSPTSLVSLSLTDLKVTVVDR